MLLVWTLLSPSQAAALDLSDIFGKSAKDVYSFGWVDQSGAKHSLEEYKGRSLILHLWASWCPPCQEEMDTMSRWVEQHPEVLFVPVSLDHSINKAAEFLSDRGIRFSVLLSDEVQARKIGAISLPTTMVIDAEGVVRQLHRGARDWSSEIFSSQLLEGLQADEKPTSADRETPSKSWVKTAHKEL